MTQQIIIRNLTTGRLSIDAQFAEGKQLRALLTPGASVDAGQVATLEEINRNTIISGLITSGKISVSVASGSGDVQNGAIDRTVYVSPNGSDNNIGTAVAPVATLKRALDLVEQGWRKAQTIQLAPGTYDHPQRQTYIGGSTFGGRSSPLLIKGTYASLLGTRAVSASNNAGGGQISDIQDSTLTIAPSSTAGALIAGAGSGRIRYSDAALIGQLSTLAVGDMFMVALGENPGNNGTFGVASFDNTTGTVDLWNSQGCLPNQIGPGTGDSITVTTDTSGMTRVVRIDDAAAAFTTAVSNKYIKITGCTNPLNNGYFPVVARNSATQIEIVNPNAVTETSGFTWNFGEANSGALYAQRAYDGCRIRFTSGSLAGQPRTVRDHGVAAQGTATFVAASAFTGGNTWTIPDGVNTRVWRFRKSGSDGLGAVLATDIDFVDNVPTAAQCAAIAAGRINTTSPASTSVRAYATLGSAVLLLVNMRLGSAGNTTMTTNAAGFTFAQFGAGTEIQINRPGFGAPLNTFRVNYRWGGAPTVADTFVVERSSSLINVAATDGVFYFTGDGGILGLQGLRFINAGGTFGFLLFAKIRIEAEGVEFDGRGGGFIAVTAGASLSSGGEFPFAADYWANQVPNPFGALDTSNTNNLFVHDMINVTFGGGSEGLYNMITSRHTDWNFYGHQAFLSLSAPDFFRSSITCGAGHMFMDATGAFFGRFKEQKTLAGTGLIYFDNNGGNASSNLNQCELIGAMGNGIRATQGATSVLSNIIGYGHGGAGIRALSSASLQIGSGVSVTGASGDIKVGNRAARSYTSFGATAPIGNEWDIAGDGARISTTTAQNFGETRTGSIAIGAATVDITFSAHMNGAPVVATLNSADATSNILRSAVWQGSGVLRVTVNANATAAVTVTASAQFPST